MQTNSHSYIDGYKITKELGKGFSAVTKLGVDSNGNAVALKVFDLKDPRNNANMMKLLKTEVENTKNLEHPHVVRYLGFSEDTEETRTKGNRRVAYIAMEPVPNGELFDYIANSGPFNAKFARHFFKQALMGLHYIHLNGFSHRDLKPENILLDD